MIINNNNNIKTSFVKIHFTIYQQFNTWYSYNRINILKKSYEHKKSKNELISSKYRTSKSAKSLIKLN